MFEYSLRRPPVNVVGSGKSSYDEESSDTSKKFCPREGRLLIFREDINSFFCPQCAYKPPLPQLEPNKENEIEVEDNNEEDPLSTVDGLQTKIGQRGTTLEEDSHDSAIRIRPIANSGRRSEQLQKDAGRRGIHGLDHDLEMMLDKPGMNLVYSSEEVSEDGVYNPQETARRRGRERF